MVICWSLPLIHPGLQSGIPFFSLHDPLVFQCFGRIQGRLVAYPFVGKTDPSMWMFPLSACSTSMVVER